MAAETIYKLQPDRTVSLRGFDRRGAAASIHHAGSGGLKCTGILRDFADVVVIDLWNPDTPYEHYTMKPLPDFDFSSITFTFDLKYNDTLQPIDSPKSPWEPWNALSYRTVSALDGTDGVGGSVNLFDHATLQAGSFTPASAAWTVTAAGSLTSSDYLTLFYRDIPFQYQGSGAGSGTVDYTYFTGGIGSAHNLRVSGLNLSIVAATNTSPIQVTTGTAHGRSSGEIVTVDHCTGNTAANGAWFITVLNSTQFTLSSSTGNGAYTGGGLVGLRREYAHTEASGEFGADDAIAIAAAAASDPWAIVDNNARTITGATNASPIQIATSAPHNMATGYVVRTSGVAGNTAANGVNFIHVVDATHFTLDGTTGNGAYTSGGVVNGSNHLLITPRVFGTETQLTATDGNANTTMTSVGAGSAAASVAGLINNYNWPVENPAIAIMAAASGSDITVKAARFGTVNVASDGVTVSWVSGDKFPGIAASSAVYIQGVKYAVSSITDPRTFVLQFPGTGGALTGQRYLAERGGWDGNMIAVQARAVGQLDVTGSASFGAYKQLNQNLTGGSSNVTWRISLDFTALGIDKLRLMWLTLVPKLANSAAYVDTEFTAEFLNWTVTDPSSHRALKVAAQGSVRIGSRDDWTHYTGTWTELNTDSGWYWKGYARWSSTSGDKVYVKYACGSTHDVWLGTSLFSDRGKVDVSIDGGTPVTLDTYADMTGPTLARRKLFTGIAAGKHQIIITLNGKRTASTGTTFIFDYLEAAIPGDVPDPVAVTSTNSAAVDFDTNHTYSMTPQRLVWNLDRLGFHGDINEYFGVFWWNQRKRVHGTNSVYTAQLGGTWAAGDSATITVSGISVRKTLDAHGDYDAGTPNNARKILAQSLVDGINNTFIGIWAEVTGAGADTVTIHPRTPMFYFPVAATKSSASGTVTETGDLNAGSEGVWEIDPTASTPINKAATDWHADFFSAVQAKGWTITVSSSMELLNPPEYPGLGQVYAARYSNGIQVLTATGFGTEAVATIKDATNASPIVIKADQHGYNTGDSTNITGVIGNTAANGTWPAITVIDDDHFSIPGSTGNGAFVPFAWGINEVLPQAVRNLHTTHCSFSSSMSTFQQSVFITLATLLNTAGVTFCLQFGEFTWWYFSYGASPVGFASFTAPISIGTPAPHGLTTGQRAIVAGVRGNTAANGTWPVTVTDSTHFTLDGSSGNGSYVGGTGRVSFGGMAYYDAETTAAASVALGRALVEFDIQDDDPAVNGHADADFLQNRLKAHIDSIRTAVLAAVPSSKFELLFPYDVNFRTCYHTLNFPFPQGGRVNAYVNFPAAYATKTGSGLDRLKVEALSWGATYRNLDNAKAAITFALTSPNSWPVADVRYLVPIFNGGCPWPAEFLYALQSSIPQIDFWAFDHFILLSWPLPLPVPGSSARLT